MASKLPGYNPTSVTYGGTPPNSGKRSFYLYQHLESIHSDFQNIIRKNKFKDVLLIMNTPGSLEHFMVHTDPDFFHEIYIDLLTQALTRREKGCLEFGYILVLKNQFHFFVKDGAGHLPFNHYDQKERFEGGPMMEELESTICLLDKLDGKMWIESLPGKGTIWWFTLDVQPSNSRNYPYKELSDTGAKPDWSEKTVLVVEDTNDNYLLLETVLGPTNLNLINVENGAKAVNFVKKNKNIDLVLMDLMLPVLDGYEASRRIKSHCPWLPIVAISAYAFGEEIDRCIKAGCDSFLCKPLNTSELIRTMSGFFDNKPVER